MDIGKRLIPQCGWLTLEVSLGCAGLEMTYSWGYYRDWQATLPDVSLALVGYCSCNLYHWKSEFQRPGDTLNFSSWWERACLAMVGKLYYKFYCYRVMFLRTSRISFSSDVGMLLLLLTNAKRTSFVYLFFFHESIFQVS